MSLSKEKVVSDNIEKINKFLINKYDIIICGSDEIWKVNGFREFPNIYWLHDNIECKKISYAASSRSDLSGLKKEKQKYIIDSLKSFEYIGIRDEKTKTEIQKLMPELNIHTNCDPTFTLEYEVDKGKVRKKLKTKYGIGEEEKLIGVMLKKPETCKQVKDKYSNYKIISLFNYVPYVDKNIMALDPFEWIEIITCLDVFVTDFFHGTIFAMKNLVPCISIENEKYGAGKIKDILTKMDLLDRICYLEDIKNNKEILLEKIQYVLNNNDKEKIVRECNKEKQKFDEFILELKKIIKNKS